MPGYVHLVPLGTKYIPRRDFDPLIKLALMGYASVAFQAAGQCGQTACPEAEGAIGLSLEGFNL